MTWGELVRALRKAGFVEQRTGRGSHRKFVHPKTGREVWVAIHTRKDAGRLADRILADAGLK